MNYEVALAPAVQRSLRKLDPAARRRIQAALDLLAIDPRPPAAVQLVGGGGGWRVRTGDYRIVYEIHDGLLTLLVLAAGPRREVCDRR